MNDTKEFLYLHLIKQTLVELHSLAWSDETSPEVIKSKAFDIWAGLRQYEDIENTTFLSEKAFDTLKEVLDNPPTEATPALKDLMSRKRLSVKGE